MKLTVTIITYNDTGNKTDLMLTNILQRIDLLRYILNTDAYEIKLRNISWRHSVVRDFHMSNIIFREILSRSIASSKMQLKQCYVIEELFRFLYENFNLCFEAV